MLISLLLLGGSAVVGGGSRGLYSGMAWLGLLLWNLGKFALVCSRGNFSVSQRYGASSILGEWERDPLRRQRNWAARLHFIRKRLLHVVAESTSYCLAAPLVSVLWKMMALRVSNRASCLLFVCFSV
jgi:hypothetical protein